MHTLLLPSALLSLLSTGAIFGFFYAYACSAMWGLDATPPQAAIAAMQGINAQVRNAAFFPAFFLTPVLLALTAGLSWGAGRGGARLPFAAAALVYLIGGMGLTLLANVPMNEALAQVTVPAEPEEAQRLWDAYSGPWQVWNATRTVFSGVALVLAGWGLYALGRAAPEASAADIDA